MTDDIKSYCSFCGKRGDDVLVLVAGPQVMICDECVKFCGEICEQHRITKLVRDALAKAEAIVPLATFSTTQAGLTTRGETA